MTSCQLNPLLALIYTIVLCLIFILVHVCMIKWFSRIWYLEFSETEAEGFDSESSDSEEILLLAENMNGREINELEENSVFFQSG